MNGPPRAKETPPVTVAAGTEGKGEKRTTISLSTSDKPKFGGDGKRGVEIRPGLWLRITRRGRSYRTGGAS